MKNRLFHPALIVFCVACAALLLQIVQTRIYAVVFWNHLVYFIVSLALLGFGISGTWLAFGPDTRLARFLTLQRAGLGFVITAVLSSLIMPQAGNAFEAALSSRFHLLSLLLTYSVTVLPYFLAGWILGVVYRDYAERIHFLYFADLVGAALGCLLVVVLLQPLGAVALVLVACAMVAVPTLLPFPGGTAMKAATVLAFAGLGALYWWEDEVNARIVPEASKAFNLQFRDLAPGDEKVVELSEWNLLARTDVVGTRKTRTKLVMIDGDAFTGMPPDVTAVPQRFNAERDTLVPHRSPYVLNRAFDSVLVIGSGGGPDVWGALRAGAKRVDAAEINPTTARIVKSEYNAFLNGLFRRPEVNLYNEEGRSFVLSRPDRFDVIMINAIDTFAATDSGAYVLAENYLYTVDAIKDYVSRLNPEGMLCISRWDYAGESPRLFAIALEALYEMGVSQPDKHIAVHESNNWASVMVSLTEFNADDLARLRRNSELSGGIAVFPLVSAEQKQPLQMVLNTYAAARREGRQEAYFDQYRYNIRPVYDDSPFFFHYRRAGELKNAFLGLNSADYIRGHWSEFTLVSLFALTSIALVLFVGVPLARRGPAVLPGFKLWVLFFCALGVSFIFVEISLMQRFALFLGHPARSLALVLAALLFFAGAGSHLKGRTGMPLQVSLGLLVVAIGVAAFAYPVIVRVLLGQPLWIREVVTVLLVAPLGLLMGMPFPTGIQAVGAEARDAVPWMWGVNGGATVLGSILAVALAIQVNFTFVLLLAAGGYATALGAYAFLMRTAEEPTVELPVENRELVKASLP